jgi:hypothetical protein
MAATTTSLRSLRTIMSRTSTRHVNNLIRPSPVNIMRRHYTATPPQTSSGGHNPLLWIGK